MTGPEHYREGERLLGLCEVYAEDGGPRGNAEAAVMVARARAHFAAAQAAAVALGVVDGVNAPATVEARHWRGVIFG